MIVYFLRHATAAREASNDTARELTKEGRQEARIAGKALHRLGVRPDFLWSSPLIRARQTAEIAAETLSGSFSVEIQKELENGRSTSELLGLLKPLPTDSTLLLVGHMPSLAEHLAALLGASSPESFPMDKGGVAALRLEELRLGKGVLRLRLRHEQLKRIA
ncbi:2,3-bisphosphoglycerate-dependent phosphoglycerate mutase [Methylacidimicrobium cyclopophantes]|uniref:2,3-bisphosphoglycerate-dependent phosphoglycerate mutase n=1 Tax=Methylacidimicrobium cyclopophantes TaxID=1041766 RepID=A0A5E6MK46_9BACT|nr:phosphohistidine phosphatase SixA [Methylacidimicrobium cyclopophantes]VVM06427.1 2,3-bisphosphoglycerate-dependent phosphoglycerate mutase [Methylacidimicrobium cyclopophantes]